MEGAAASAGTERNAGQQRAQRAQERAQKRAPRAQTAQKRAEAGQSGGHSVHWCICAKNWLGTKLRRPVGMKKKTQHVGGTNPTQARATV